MLAVLQHDDKKVYVVILERKEKETVGYLFQFISDERQYVLVLCNVYVYVVDSPFNDFNESQAFVI